MYTTSIRKVGGSSMLAIPPALLDVLNLLPGATVELTVEPGRLIVEPNHRYTLDELISRCDARAPRARKDREWLDGRSAGGELL